MSTLFEDLILRDIAASRPAAGKPGRLFFDTTNGKLQRDNGSSWDDVESTAAAGVGRSGSTTDLHLAIWAGSNADLIKDGGPVLPSGRVLIAENTPTGTGTTSFTSIPATYKKLLMEFAVRSTQAATNVNWSANFNGDATGSNYRGQEGFLVGTTAGANAFASAQFTTGICGNNAPANEFSIGVLEIIQYANTGINKHMQARFSHKRDTSSLFELDYRASLNWINTAAISQWDLILSAGNYAAGSVLRLYGLL